MKRKCEMYMTCEGCGSEKIFARKLCQACYWRLRRNGTLERKNAVNHGKCGASGCREKAIAKGLCSRHYQRVQHPLMATWKLLRSRAKGNYPAEWDVLDAFLLAVGSKPSEEHQLRRIDPTKPWSQENFIWLDPVHPEKKRIVYQAEYGRAWSLKRKYGITTDEYTKMSEKQKGLCAICGKKETTREPRTGRLKELAVDHCHKTGRARGLLCSQCNKGIGHFDDDVERIKSAITYLESHK